MNPMMVYHRDVTTKGNTYKIKIPDLKKFDYTALHGTVTNSKNPYFDEY